MSKKKFDKNQSAIIVPVSVEAGGITSDFEFVVGTGSVETLITEKALKAMGYTPEDSVEKEQTERGIIYRYIVDSITAIGITRRNVKVKAQQMPNGSGVYGLLGLDFFENTRLTINFKEGEIMVEENEKNDE